MPIAKCMVELTVFFVGCLLVMYSYTCSPPLLTLLDPMSRVRCDWGLMGEPNDMTVRRCGQCM
jgi:hypothetical protein